MVRNFMEVSMLGLELKIARIRKGRTQLEVAREVGIHPSRLSKLENGWEQPRPNELKAIRTALALIEEETTTALE